ncbi:MAG: hypothetical protein AAFO06_07345 [Cyanobacteria bacterium J06597_16]
MKSFAKLTLLTLLCCTAVEAVTHQQAKAGIEPAGVTTTGSGAIGINFSPALSVEATTSTSAGINSNANTVAALIAAIKGQAASFTPGAVPVSPVPRLTIPGLSSEGASSVQAALTATPANVEAVATALATQISTEVSKASGGGASGGETSGVVLSAETTFALARVAEAVSALGASPANLPEAIAAINLLINTASRAELEALAKSPSFMAARQALVTARTVVRI